MMKNEIANAINAMQSIKCDEIAINEDAIDYFDSIAQIHAMIARCIEKSIYDESSLSIDFADARESIATLNDIHSFDAKPIHDLIAIFE